jgi:hypothetical protein
MNFALGRRRTARLVAFTILSAFAFFLVHAANGLKGEVGQEAFFSIDTTSRIVVLTEVNDKHTFALARKEARR